MCLTLMTTAADIWLAEINVKVQEFLSCQSVMHLINQTHMIYADSHTNSMQHAYYDYYETI